MANEFNLTLSAYDQSLGIGTPSLYRLFYLERMPDLERLVFSLGKTLERFPRFATRIVLADDGRSKLIPLNESLAVELRPATNCTLKDFRITQVPHFVRGLTTEAGEPVLAIAVTPVADGAVLGVSCSHAAGDMYSYYLFLAYWNEQIRSTADSRKDVGPCSAKLLDLSEGMISGRGGVYPSVDGAPGNGSQDYLIVGFDHAELGELRSELSKDNVLPSLNEAVTAYVVHRLICRMMDDQSNIRLRVPISLRGIHPLVPKDFFGNAIIEALVPINDLADTPAVASATAHRIREAVRAARSRQNLDHNVIFYNNGIEYTGGEYYAFDEVKDVLCTNVSKMAFSDIGFGCGASPKIFGLTHRGLRIAATEHGLEAHIWWDERRGLAQLR